MSNNADLFGALILKLPVHVEWREADQVLVLSGSVPGVEGHVKLVLESAAAIECLRRFRTLLDQVDEEALAPRKPRGLQ